MGEEYESKGVEARRQPTCPDDSGASPIGAPITSSLERCIALPARLT